MFRCVCVHEGRTCARVCVGGECVCTRGSKTQPKRARTHKPVFMRASTVAFSMTVSNVSLLYVSSEASMHLNARLDLSSFSGHQKSKR